MVCCVKECGETKKEVSNKQKQNSKQPSSSSSFGFEGKPSKKITRVVYHLLGINGSENKMK